MPTKEEITKFSIGIENFVQMNREYDYVDAVVEYCRIVGLEIEIAASLVSPSLKSKIEYDAVQRNLLKEKGARLPI